MARIYGMCAERCYLKLQGGCYRGGDGTSSNGDKIEKTLVTHSAPFASRWFMLTRLFRWMKQEDSI